jgi:hypothetical protein
MTATLALLTLLFAPAQSAAPAAPPTPPSAQSTSLPCQTFTRESEAPPPLVRAWLATSGDQRVRVCPQPGPQGAQAAPLYFGEGGVTREGAVCSYDSHGLTTMGSGASQRLRRIDRTEALAMALAGQDCPLPQASADANAYVMTYDTSRAAFVAIMQRWSALSSSRVAFEHELACCSAGGAQPGAVPGAAEGAEIRRHLRAQIDSGRMMLAPVSRIVRIPGSTLRRRYALFVKEPDRASADPRFYVIYLQRRLRGPVDVIGIAETN